jgi:YD repeat-containing protein
MTGFPYLVGTAALTATLGYNASGLRSSYAVPTSVGTSVVGTRAETILYRDGQIGSVGVISSGVSYTDTFVYDPHGQPLGLLHNTSEIYALYVYVHDGRGNVVALTDVSGKVVNSYSYDAWGNVLTSSETVNQPYRRGLLVRPGAQVVLADGTVLQPGAGSLPAARSLHAGRHFELCLCRQ